MAHFSSRRCAASRSPSWRRRPARTPAAASSPGTIGLFQLSMIGIGATIGTGIFFVLSPGRADRRTGGDLVVRHRRGRRGLTAVCYAELASAVPVSGSSYSYAYATLGELVAMGVAACLLLEYGVSSAAVAVGWSEYLNQLLGNVFGVQIPEALSKSPGGRRLAQPPGRGAGRAVRAAADPGHQRVGDGQRDHGRDQARGAGAVRRARNARLGLGATSRRSRRSAWPGSPPPPGSSSSPTSAWTRCPPPARR